MTYHVRPATFDDHAGVQSLMREAGWPQRSKAGWDWLFQKNPALNGACANTPIGWVIAKTGVKNGCTCDGEKLSGYIANIPVDYAIGARNIKAATCSAYYVCPEARAMSIKLMSAFFRQKGVELLLSTTANDMSAPLYGMFKAKPPEHASYRETLCFILDDAAVLREAATRKAKLPAVLAKGVEVLAPLSYATRFLAGYASLPRDDFKGTIKLLEPGEIGVEFDAFWQALRNTGHLTARRDAKTLKWRMSDPDLDVPMKLITAYDGAGLAGYALCALHRPGAGTLARMKLLDLSTRPSSPDVSASLLNRAIDEARLLGAALIEVPHGGAKMADAMKPHHPIRLRSAHASHYARTRDNEISKALADPTGWNATGLDGDISMSVTNAD